MMMMVMVMVMMMLVMEMMARRRTRDYSVILTIVTVVNIIELPGSCQCASLPFFERLCHWQMQSLLWQRQGSAKKKQDPQKQPESSMGQRSQETFGQLWALCRLRCVPSTRGPSSPWGSRLPIPFWRLTGGRRWCSMLPNDPLSEFPRLSGGYIIPPPKTKHACSGHGSLVFFLCGVLCQWQTSHEKCCLNEWAPPEALRLVLACCGGTF